MTKKIAAIAFIFVCTSIAWIFLASTIDYRSSAPADGLRAKVANTWGAPHEQKPPSAYYEERAGKTEKVIENGKEIERIIETTTQRPVPLNGSKVNSDIHLEYRQKGLLWFSTYQVRFDAVYSFQNPANKEQLINFVFPYPAARATYDGLAMTIDGDTVSNVQAAGYVKTSKVIPPGGSVQVGVRYRSQGLDRWTYSFDGQPAQVRNFALAMTTDFKDIDFPEDTLSPTARQETGNGWRLTWNYDSLVTSYPIAMEMPAKLQPGPLAGQISYFAPVSLFFFFFLLFIITTMRDIDLHPMHYFFIASAFFAFHLLLAYLVDHLSIHWSFVICSVVSIFLLVSYLRLVVNARFALVEAGIAQFCFLVLFSYAFFFKGFTGLAITIGAVITLFLVMQITGKVDWADKFRSLPDRPRAPQES
jgi:inner membrane protein involved in colicin E2 resistance